MLVLACTAVETNDSCQKAFEFLTPLRRVRRQFAPCTSLTLSPGTEVILYTLNFSCIALISKQHFFQREKWDSEAEFEEESLWLILQTRCLQNTSISPHFQAS